MQTASDRVWVASGVTETDICYKRTKVLQNNFSYVVKNLRNKNSRKDQLTSILHVKQWKTLTNVENKNKKNWGKIDNKNNNNNKID